MAKVSRQFKFEGLDAESTWEIYDFRDKHLGTINVTFGSTPGTATIEWKTPEQRQLLEKLAKEVAE